MSWMRSARPVVEKLNSSSAAISSGGSITSTSEIAVDSTVTVHVSFCCRSAWGSRTNVVDGPPGETASGTLPLLVQASVNASVPAVTGSLNVTVTFVPTGTSVAPSGGVVAATNGAASAAQKCGGESAVRGPGVAAVKSAAFESVSWHPPSLRRAAVVLLRPGAVGPSE
jgi:hypothetical protein